MTMFIIDGATQTALTQLAKYADINRVPLEQLKSLAQMAAEGTLPNPPFPNHTITMPFGFVVTFTVEQHPQSNNGSLWMRHLSMSSPKSGNAPIALAIEMVMHHLGYSARKVEDCITWPEPLERNRVAINVMEPLAFEGVTH